MFKESNNISSPKKEFDFDDKPQKSLNEKQQVCPLFWCLFLDYFVDPSYSCYSLQLTFWSLQENQDLLIRCIAQHLGFAGNRPVAACIIYKCLLHWRSFEVERTSVFDRIIQTIGHAIEVITIPYNSVIIIQN